MQAGSPHRKVRIAGAVLFVVGLLATLALAALAIWGDFEASLFDISIRAESNVDSLRCPILLAAHEQGQISAAFRNTSERPVERAVRARISAGFITLIREENAKLPLQPGQSARRHWDVSPADAVYNGRIILARVSALRQSPMPSQSGTCGIVVLNIPWLSGQAVVWGWLSVALAALAGGSWLWWRHRAQTPRQRVVALTASANALVVLAVLVCGLTGQWLLGMIVLALLVLLMLATLAQMLQGS